ncbi:MAG: HU family DNA-binding protein [Bryobacteraceae bacterium]
MINIAASGFVTKRDLVARIAADAALTRAQAARALEACVAGIQAGLRSGDRVIISGFGTFGVFQRKARVVRNPRNGRAIEIAARKVPRFAPGVELRAALDGMDRGDGPPHPNGR